MVCNVKNEDNLFIRGIDLKVAIEWFDDVDVLAHMSYLPKLRVRVTTRAI